MHLRLDIQGLRALAVILVIVFHIDESILPGGYIGVDIFFVISGFLISKSVFSQIDHKKFNLFRFFEGRIKRIVPAYFAMLLICIIVATFVFIPVDHNTFFHQLKRTFIFLSNQLFAVTDNYFGAKSYENPLLHTWSLGIEMQFYVFLPLLLLIVPKKLRILVFISLFVVLLAYTEYNLRIAGQKAQMYFSLAARSVEFMIGIAVNFLPGRKANKSSQFEILAILSLVTIIGSALLLDSKSLFPGLLSLPACVATALLIWMEKSNVNAFLALSVPNYIGKISYSLYLWHWPVLSFYRYHLMEYSIPFLDLFMVILCFTALSLLSFYFVEDPFRKWKGKRFYISLGVLAAVMGALWFFSKKVNQNLIDIPEKYISPKAFNNNNHNQYSGYELLGDTNKKDDRILIIGDSHGLGMLPFMEVMGKKHSLNFSAITMNHYPPLPGLKIKSLTNEIDETAYLQLAPIADRLIKESKIIILIKYWPGPNDSSLRTNI